MPFEKDLFNTFINDNSLPIRNMQRSSFPEDDDHTFFQRKLQKLKEVASNRVLLIIDNFNVSDDENLEAICSGEYSILFTTQNHQVLQSIPEIEIREIPDEDELIEVFKIEYKRSLDQAGLQAVREIINLYHGHTLSLRLIAGAMQSQRIAPQTMLNILQKHQNEELTNTREKKASDLIFQQIQHVFMLSNLSDSERKILMNLSLVPMCGISVELLYELCGFDDFDVIDGLIGKSWIIHNDLTDEVYLHPIIAELAGELLAASPDACNKMLENLLKRGNSRTFRKISYTERLEILGLLESVANRLPSSQQFKKRVEYCIASCYCDNAQYRQAESLYQNLLKIETENDLKLHCYEKIMQCLVLSGENEDARKVADEGWNFAKAFSSNELSNEIGQYYIGLMHRLIEIYRSIGDYDASLYYGRLCFETCGRFYSMYEGDSHAWTMYHIGRTMLLKGDITDGIEMIQNAMGVFKPAGDLYSYACCCDMMALLFSRMGKFNDAIEYNNTAREIMLPLVGDEHIDIAHNYKWAGDIYFEAGRIVEAEENYRKSLLIYNKRNFTRFAKQVGDILDEVE